MFKILLLLAVLAFVCWSLYNIEGFQNPPDNQSAQPSGSGSKCDMMIPIYKGLEEKYNRAVIDNNTNLIEVTLPAVNNMKEVLKSINCIV